jgi:hypothetical protein
MPENTKDKSNNLLKGVFVAHFILLLHALLVIGIGLMILFFSGLVNYIAWLLIGGLALIAGAGYLLYKKAEKQGKNLQEMLALPHFAGKNIEISILGGMASIKVESNAGDSTKHLPDSDTVYNAPRLESPITIQVNELTELAKLLEKNLITEEEFNLAKRKILNID